jgi:hypothetical protein
VHCGRHAATIKSHQKFVASVIPMAFSFSRHVVILPAWTWVVLTPLLVLIAYLLGKPADLPEPAEAASLFEPPILVTRDGDQRLRLVPLEGSQGIFPLWSVNRETTAKTSVDWDFQLGTDLEKLGFWMRTGHWQYALASAAFGAEGQSSVRLARTAPPDASQLRPMVVNALNLQSPDDRRGDRLAQMLDAGIERRSMICIANAVILLAWLSLPMAFFGVLAMFIEPGRRGKDKAEAIKIEVRKR